LSKELVIQSKSLDEIFKLAKEKSKLLVGDSGDTARAERKFTKQIASGFGYRSDPFTKVRKFHAGMDFSAKIRNPYLCNPAMALWNVPMQYGFGLWKPHCDPSRLRL
jgi:hypothetical protein